jgi:phage baseplate assembly protein W
MATPKTTYIINIPFNLSTYGSVSRIADNDIQVWRNKITAIFSIATNERIWYHNYGADLSGLLFEPSNIAIEDARAAISEVFVSWLPTLKLLDIAAVYDSTNASLILTLTYQVPSGMVDSVKITNAALTISGETSVNN